MFGYVRPLRRELKVGWWEDYQAVYCGLCHALKRRCGLAARFTLNYDFVFLAMLLDSGEDHTLCSKRCVAHPLRPRPCVEGGAAFDLAAEESVILARYKLLDSVADEGFWKSAAARLGAAALGSAYRRAKTARPEFDRHTAVCLEELTRLEREGSASLDATADAFARLLQGAAPHTGDPARDRPAAQLLYHLGRWIYLADAVNDLEEDEKAGRYNPVAARFGGQPDLEYMATTMTHSLTLAQSAFQLLPRARWADILENILYLGLPTVQKRALAGEWNEKDTKARSML